MNKLEVGQVFKNYNKVCEWLGVKPTKGKGRLYHLREFDRYCKNHIEGWKYIVDEVYETPLDKIDNRGGNNNIYGTLMDDLIIEILINNGGIIAENFISIFCEYIPLFSNDYKYENLINTDELAKKIFATEGLINLYNSKKRDIVVGLFERSLNRLKKENIINWEKCFGIKNIENEVNIICKDNKLYQDIKDAKKELCDEIGMNEFMILKDMVKYKEFKKVISEKLNIKAFWSLYKIVLIQNIEMPPTDINELKKLFIINLHKGLVEKENTNNYGEIYQPYKNKAESIVKLDKKFWQGEEVIDIINYQFGKLYNKNLFGGDAKIEEEIALENYESSYDDTFEFPY